MTYKEAYTESLEAPDVFWAKAAETIAWNRKWDKVCDFSSPPFSRWFTGGELNTCYNALDRHIEAGRGEQAALIYDSPVTNTIRTYSYRETRDRVAGIAGFLKSLGVGTGDTVVIYMPMIPETVMAMLACSRIGAIHSVVFGGFAPRELAVRIDNTRPLVLLSASSSIESKGIVSYGSSLEHALNLSRHKPRWCVIFQRPQATLDLRSTGYLDWNELEERANAADCVPVKATDPLYILHTSGTTGMPKGVVRDNGGHAVALMWSMKHIYGVDPGDVYWTASDLGWVTGHSYMVYAPLLNGSTTVIFEGRPVGTPDPGAFWRVISQHRVKVLFTAPSALRAIKWEDPHGDYLKKYEMPQFDSLFLGGERTDADTFRWASNLLKRPIIDHWWQTETGWAIAGNFRGLEMFPPKPGSVCMPVPGYDLKVLNPESGKPLGKNKEGLITLRLPLPPGTLVTLWENDQRFRDSYMDPYPGYYLTGDGGYIDEDGYVWVTGRTDDVINVAGHRLSTGGMEEVVARHPDIAECAVLGVADGLKGMVPIGLLVLRAGVTRDPREVVQEVVRKVGEEIGPISCFKHAVVVERLPKTRSGKILRGTIRKIANAEPHQAPSTIEDASVLDEIEAALKTIGYAKR